MHKFVIYEQIDRFDHTDINVYCVFVRMYTSVLHVSGIDRRIERHGAVCLAPSAANA